jgi:hypothetical protein
LPSHRKQEVFLFAITKKALHNTQQEGAKRTTKEGDYHNMKQEEGTNRDEQPDENVIEWTAECE